MFQSFPTESATDSYRKTTVAEGILDTIDVTFGEADDIEVFEFKRDFDELIGRGAFLVDVGGTVEFHLPEPGGATVRLLRNDGSLRSACRVEFQFFR